MVKKAIPVIFAVTGHMDISQDSVTKSKKIVKEIFETFNKEYPHTSALLISALAEGADMLVAEVALECGIELHVMLPYQEEMYLKSFKNSKNIQTFKKLKSMASRVEVVSDINVSSLEDSYELLGKKLADLSTILIALWDGKDNGKRGGTSEVVKYKEKSLKNNEKNRHMGSAIYIININRKNSDYTEKIFLEKRYIGLHVDEQEFDKILKKIDKINLEIKSDNEKSLTYLHSLMKFFEKKAYRNQKKFKLYLKLILIVSAISIISLEFFHDFGVHISLMLYGIGIIIAFFIYYFFMKKGDIQNNFVHSRGFVEALRVQNIWNASNLNLSVADYYLVNQHHKYLWIKVSLKNMSYIDNAPFNPINDKKFMPEYWIDEQIEYYRVALINRNKRYRFWENTEKFFYMMGLIFLVLMFVYYFSEKLLGADIPHLLHIFIFSSGISLLLAVLIGEQYNQIEGFEEEIYNFEIMNDFFLNTKAILNNFIKDSDEYKETLCELGVGALNENSKWLVSHDIHIVKPILE